MFYVDMIEVWDRLEMVCGCFFFFNLFGNVII